MKISNAKSLVKQGNPFDKSMKSSVIALAPPAILAFIDGLHLLA